MRILFALLFTFLSLSSAQQLHHQRNDDPQVARLEASLAEKKDLLRAHESGERRLKEIEHKGVTEMIGKIEKMLDPHRKMQEWDQAVSEKKQNYIMELEKMVESKRRLIDNHESNRRLMTSDQYDMVIREVNRLEAKLQSLQQQQEEPAEESEENSPPQRRNQAIAEKSAQKPQPATTTAEKKKILEGGKQKKFSYGNDAHSEHVRRLESLINGHRRMIEAHIAGTKKMSEKDFAAASERLAGFEKKIDSLSKFADSSERRRK